MATESNAKEKPWEATAFPDAEIIFRCPGRGWHDYTDHRPYDLVWVQGLDGSKCPEDGYYCELCIYGAKDHAKKKGVALVTGPTLEEELERDHMHHLVNDRWLQAPDVTIQYHSALHATDSVYHLYRDCPSGKNVKKRCWCHTERPASHCVWCSGRWASLGENTRCEAYVVVGPDCGLTDVDAVCSTREMAEGLAEVLADDCRADYEYDGWPFSHEDVTFSVQKCPVDPDWNQGFYVVVAMDRTGALVKAPRRSISLDDLPFQAILSFGETPEGSLYLSHFAATRDVDLAVKQTNDIREQAIALEYWPDETVPSQDFESRFAAGQRLATRLGGQASKAS